MAEAGRVLLAVHAHPDDECIGTGGMLARYGTEGVRTVLVTCTDGAVGEISDPALATPENLAEVRSHELDESVRILGISRLVKLGYRDSGMAGTADNDNPLSFHQADFDVAVGRVVRVVREERPQIIVTYDENGGYGHPDHIRAHQVAVAAFAAAADGARFPEAGEAWAPQKLYYAVVPSSGFQRLRDRLKEAGIEIPWGDDEPEVTVEAGADADAEAETSPRSGFGVSDDRITTSLDVAEYVETKRSSLVAHATQMGPDQFFMKIPPDIFGEIFGREFYQRVSGPTDGSSPETDLFAGL